LVRTPAGIVPYIVASFSYTPGGYNSDGTVITNNVTIANVGSPLPAPPPGASPGDHYLQRDLGFKEYELNDHLSNVLDVVSDRKVSIPNGLGTGVLYYTADVMQHTDYYPFGQTEWDRYGATGNAYRFAYNGMEHDDESKGTNNSYSTEFRQYDPRLARWFSLDPDVKYNESPYTSMSDNPILLSDPTGDNAETKKKVTDKKKKTGKATIKAKVYLVKGGDISPGDLQAYKERYEAKVKAYYNKGQFKEDGITYTVNVELTVVVANSVDQAKDEIVHNGESNFANVLTVGKVSPETKGRGSYNDGTIGFAGFGGTEENAIPHEFAHFLGLPDLYVNIYNLSNDQIFTLSKYTKNATPNSNEISQPGQNLMAMNNSTGVLDDAQWSQVFAHGVIIASKTLVAPIIYFINTNDAFYHTYTTTFPNPANKQFTEGYGNYSLPNSSSGPAATGYFKAHQKAIMDFINGAAK
jgi:RHS repeat-associated protein